jgi:hypothetical protein
MQERLAARECLVAQVDNRFGELLLQKAAELAKFGFVQIRTPAGTVDGRIVRFRYGLSVLELFPHAVDGHIVGPGKTELARAQEPDLHVLVGYLARAVADLGPGAEVLA